MISCSFGFNGNVATIRLDGGAVLGRNSIHEIINNFKLDVLYCLPSYHLHQQTPYY